jgi:hypothetical protein
MFDLERGRYAARLAHGAADLSEAQRPRARAFHDAPPGARWRCVRRGLRSCAGRRYQTRHAGVLFPDDAPASGAEIERPESAQSYNLGVLVALDGRTVEPGRFCAGADRRDPDILCVACGAMAAHVTQTDVTQLFGCSSFSKTHPRDHAGVFALLKARHLAPRCWRPKV